MHLKSATIVLLICGFSILSLLAGFGLGRISRGTGGDVLIYSERARAEYQRSVEQNPDFKGIEPRLLEQFRNMKPLVKAGRLIINRNDTTGDYSVFDEHEPIAYKTTDGDETTLTYFGEGSHVSIDLTYKRGTTELLRCAFTTYGDGGVFGPLKHYYMDTDGDGRFDRFSDHEAGKFYELKDLQWVLIDSAQSDDK